MENEWKNKKRKRKGEKEIPPLYTAEEAIKSLEIFEPVQYDEIIEITKDIHVRFNDAGHMLGSSIIELWTNEDGKETKTVFTGDLGNNDLPLLDSPTMIETADYLIMESTYGSRLHVRNDEKAEMFLDIVSETLDNEGTVVIPSFAVGRTQEILYEINKLKEVKDDEEFRRKYKTLMRSNVYVDSPLAISATEVFKENTYLFEPEIKEEILKGDNPLEFPGLKFTQTADESKALNQDPTPSIIISASGMCEVGRIKHHLKHNLWNPKSTILFVGYQAPGTLGYSIVNGAKTVKIFGEEIAVNARIEYIEGYSGHADQEGLMNFVYSFIKKPKHIFLVHGEEESQKELKQKIEEDASISVTIPEFGETYQLNAENQENQENQGNCENQGNQGNRENQENREEEKENKSVELTQSTIKMTNKIERKAIKTIRTEVINRLEKLKEEMKDMDEYVRQDMNDKNLKDQDIFRINEKIKELEKQIINVIEG